MKVGIIGSRWGLMHVGGFRAAGAEIAALCGRQPDRTRDVAQREGIPLATVDVEELCRASELVVVAGPDALHAEHVRVALEHGRPVLCEKPLATTEADAERMAGMASASGRACAVNFPYRTLPPVAQLRSVIAGRPVRHVACTVHNSFAAGATDASGDLGGVSHLLDAALWLAGAAPVWVHAALSGHPVNSAALHVGLSTGALLVITHIAVTEPGIRGTWLVAGDGWEASFTGGYAPARGGWIVSAPMLVESGASRQVGDAIEPVAGHREPWAEAHVTTARHFLRAVAGAPIDPLAGFADGLAVQRVLAAAVVSDERGGRVDVSPGQSGR
jgi:predicted dehydrogenase